MVSLQELLARTILLLFYITKNVAYKNETVALRGLSGESVGHLLKVTQGSNDPRG